MQRMKDGQLSERNLRLSLGSEEQSMASGEKQVIDAAQGKANYAEKIHEEFAKERRQRVEKQSIVRDTKNFGQIIGRVDETLKLVGPVEFVSQKIILKKKQPSSPVKSHEQLQALKERNKTFKSENLNESKLKASAQIHGAERLSAKTPSSNFQTQASSQRVRISQVASPMQAKHQPKTQKNRNKSLNITNFSNQHLLSSMRTNRFEKYPESDILSLRSKEASKFDRQSLLGLIQGNNKFIYNLRVKASSISQQDTDTATIQFDDASQKIRNLRREVRDLQIKKIDKMPQGFKERLEELQRQQTFGNSQTAPSYNQTRFDTTINQDAIRQALENINLKTKRTLDQIQQSEANQQGERQQILTKNELLLISLNDRISKKMLTRSKLQRESNKLQAEYNRLSSNFEQQTIAKYQQNHTKAMQILSTIEKITGEINILHAKKKQQPIEWRFKKEQIETKLQELLEEEQGFEDHKKLSEKFVMEITGEETEVNFARLSNRIEQLELFLSSSNQGQHTQYLTQERSINKSPTQVSLNSMQQKSIKILNRPKLPIQLQKIGDVSSRKVQADYQRSENNIQLLRNSDVHKDSRYLKIHSVSPVKQEGIMLIKGDEQSGGTSNPPVKLVFEEGETHLKEKKITDPQSTQKASNKIDENKNKPGKYAPKQFTIVPLQIPNEVENIEKTEDQKLFQLTVQKDSKPLPVSSVQQVAPSQLQKQKIENSNLNQSKPVQMLQVSTPGEELSPVVKSAVLKSGTSDSEHMKKIIPKTLAEISQKPEKVIELQNPISGKLANQNLTSLVKNTSIKKDQERAGPDIIDLQLPEKPQLRGPPLKFDINEEESKKFETQKSREDFEHEKVKATKNSSLENIREGKQVAEKKSFQMHAFTSVEPRKDLQDISDQRAMHIANKQTDRHILNGTEIRPDINGDSQQAVANSNLVAQKPEIRKNLQVNIPVGTPQDYSDPNPHEKQESAQIRIQLNPEIKGPDHLDSPKVNFSSKSAVQGKNHDISTTNYGTDLNAGANHSTLKIHLRKASLVIDDDSEEDMSPDSEMLALGNEKQKLPLENMADDYRIERASNFHRRQSETKKTLPTESEGKLIKSSNHIYYPEDLVDELEDDKLGLSKIGMKDNGKKSRRMLYSGDLSDLSDISPKRINIEKRELNKLESEKKVDLKRGETKNLRSRHSRSKPVSVAESVRITSLEKMNKSQLTPPLLKNDSSQHPTIRVDLVEENEHQEQAVGQKTEPQKFISSTAKNQNELAGNQDIFGNQRRPIKLKTYEIRNDKSTEEFGVGDKDQEPRPPSLIFNTNVPELRMGARKISRKSLVLRGSHDFQGLNNFEEPKNKLRESSLLDTIQNQDFSKRNQGNTVSQIIKDFPEKNLMKDPKNAPKDFNYSSSNFLEVKSPPQRKILDPKPMERSPREQSERHSFHPWDREALDLSISVNGGQPKIKGLFADSLGRASKKSRSPNSSNSRFTRIGSKQLRMDDLNSSVDFSSYVRYSSHRSRKNTDLSQSVSSNHFIDEYYL